MKAKFVALPFFGNEKLKLQEQKRLFGLMISYHLLTTTLGYFRHHNQFCLVDKMLGLIEHLDDEEAELFELDLRKVQNNVHGKLFMYGVGKFYCGNDLISPVDDL